MAEEAKRAEGGDFFQNNMKAAAVGPPAAVDIESGKGGAALVGYDDGSSDRGTLSVLTFLKIVSANRTSADTHKVVKSHVSLLKS